MSFTQTVAAVRLAQTRRPDNLQDIALRELGDADRWRDLAALNGLVPPYLVNDLADMGPGLLLAGQQPIKIPAASRPPSGVADDVDLYGTDVLLIQGRLTATAGGDIATVSGIDNLAAALGRRLSTAAGALRYHPEYGCLAYRLLGKGGSQSVIALAASYVARAIRADSRVSSVQSPTATLNGDGLTATAVAVAIDGKPIPVGTS